MIPYGSTGLSTALMGPDVVALEKTGMNPILNGGMVRVASRNSSHPLSISPIPQLPSHNLNRVEEPRTSVIDTSSSNVPTNHRKKTTTNSSVPSSSPLPVARPSDWKLQMIESAIKDIERAEFVALDLEFSGLFRARGRQHHLEEYFKECSGSAKEFMALQLGVCPVWRASSDDEYVSRLKGSNNSSTTKGHDVWLMAPYNFHIFPACKKTFLVDNLTLAWLLENGFSFKDWIRNGFDYARLAGLEKTDRFSWRRNVEKVKQEGLQRIIQIIVDNVKPVVMHNGLFDMLHIHDKFIDEPPISLPEFCHEWLRIFNAGTFDTKHIANEGLHTVLHIGTGTALNELYQTLHQKRFESHVVLARRTFTSNSKTRPNTTNEAPNETPIVETMEERTSAVPMTGSYSLMPVPTGHANSKCHEAGYDALITAQVFLMELELFHRQERNNEESPVQSTAPLANSGSDSGSTTESSTVTRKPCIPFDWRSSACFGQPFADFIELVHVAPGKLDLKGHAAGYSLPSSKPHRVRIRTATPTPPTMTTAVPTTRLIAPPRRQDERLPHPRMSTTPAIEARNHVAAVTPTVISGCCVTAARTSQSVRAPVCHTSKLQSVDDGCSERPPKRRRTECQMGAETVGMKPEEAESMQDDEEDADEDEEDEDIVEGSSSDGTSGEISSSSLEQWSLSDPEEDDVELKHNATLKLLKRRVQNWYERRSTAAGEKSSSVSSSEHRIRKAMRHASLADVEPMTIEVLTDEEKEEAAGARPRRRMVNVEVVDDSPLASSRNEFNGLKRSRTVVEQRCPPPSAVSETAHLPVAVSAPLGQLRHPHRPTSTWAIPLLQHSQQQQQSLAPSSVLEQHPSGPTSRHLLSSRAHRYFNSSRPTEYHQPLSLACGKSIGAASPPGHASTKTPTATTERCPRSATPRD